MLRSFIPYARSGQVVGLFGGSFDPPHPGHVHVTLEAMKAFGLDRVWWLVSPGNPLKEHGPAPLARRVNAAKTVMRHPRVEVTDLEALTGTRATADTLAALRRLYPHVKFVWLMGADNLAQFHKWKDWRLIMDSVPVGVVARPGDRISARMSPAARIYAKYRIDGQARHLLGRAQAPAWCFINAPMINVSSTEIRSRGDWSGRVLPE
ncbi:nicotinate-nucleotide adenylyltransferase [Ruegeria profundi]|uniref:Probable nicotinate-nucleotide adenylyltransferase n=1 Tax=Ruegeria profundi TaxID=1685378 RepID=A0A0X3TRR3_9RHOB|nr:nicotinate-nucleotide adenylyltransferase [Ruegeria profundi]KUJ78389.1 nicotinate-nicotinamide nucleotide adenylyltransferase [Ruegeria profundi]